MDGNHLGKWTGAVQYFIPPVLNRLKVVDGDVERKCHFFYLPGSRSNRSNRIFLTSVSPQFIYQVSGAKCIKSCRVPIHPSGCN